MAHSIASAKRSSSSKVVYTLGEMRSPSHSSCPMATLMMRCSAHSQRPSAAVSNPSTCTFAIPQAKPGFRLVLRLTRSFSSSRRAQ